MDEKLFFFAKPNSELTFNDFSVLNVMTPDQMSVKSSWLQECATNNVCPEVTARFKLVVFPQFLNSYVISLLERDSSVMKQWSSNCTASLWNSLGKERDDKKL